MLVWCDSTWTISFLHSGSIPLIRTNHHLLVSLTLCNKSHPVLGSRVAPSSRCSLTGHLISKKKKRPLAMWPRNHETPLSWHQEDGMRIDDIPGLRQYCVFMFLCKVVFTWIKACVCVCVRIRRLSGVLVLPVFRLHEDKRIRPVFVSPPAGPLWYRLTCHMGHEGVHEAPLRHQGAYNVAMSLSFFTPA